jgi:membrane protein YqaA with SNARE-associated domain
VPVREGSTNEFPILGGKTLRTGGKPRGCIVMGRDRRSRRKRTQARKNREKLKEVASTISRETQRAVMFLGMLAAFAGSLVAFLAGAMVYAALLFAFALIVGAALLKLDMR